MYDILHNLLEDKKGGIIFTCFGLYHLIYILIGICITTCLIILIKKKKIDAIKTINIVLDIAIIMYALDFFLMPLAYGEIDIEKLPFHACTCMCVMSFLSRHIKKLDRFKYAFAMLGLISNMIYFFYPAGVMWHAVHPLCYRVIQTLSYHMVMMIYGLLVLIFERSCMNYKEMKYDLVVIVGMTVWALIGNWCYNGMLEGGKLYNWFFVVEDPFGIINHDIAIFIMPIITPCAFLFVTFLIYLINIIIKRILIRNKTLKEK